MPKLKKKNSLNNCQFAKKKVLKKEEKRNYTPTLFYPTLQAHS